MSMITKVLGQGFDKAIGYIDENIAPILKDNPNVKELIVNNKLNPELRKYPDESVSYVVLCVISQLITLGIADSAIVNKYWQSRQAAAVELNNLIKSLSE